MPGVKGRCFVCTELTINHLYTQPHNLGTQGLIDAPGTCTGTSTQLLVRRREWAAGRRARAPRGGRDGRSTGSPIGVSFWGLFWSDKLLGADPNQDRPLRWARGRNEIGRCALLGAVRAGAHHCRRCLPVHGAAVSRLPPPVHITASLPHKALPGLRQALALAAASPRWSVLTRTFASVGDGH